jgi:hypothetical protein
MISMEEHLRIVNEAVLNAIRETAAELAKSFVTMESAQDIAERAVPEDLQHLTDSQGAGDVMMRGHGGAYWGTIVPDLEILGEDVLYRPVIAREYDENGDLVAIGSELVPSDYASHAAYKDALEAIGHTLKPTWDWFRFTSNGG